MSLRVPRVGRRQSIAGLVTAAVVVGCIASSGGVAVAKSQAAHVAVGKVYRVYLSNNYVGNDWRVQMEKEAEVAATLAPFKGHVKLTIANADNTVTAQIESLQAIIATKPDAILIDAASPSALNPTISRACAEGIVVVNFDQPLTAPCAYKVYSNLPVGFGLAGTWLASTLHGKGQVFEDTALAGAPLAQVVLNTWSKTLKQNPGIAVDGTFQGQYAIGPEQQGVTSLLAAHPDVSGILDQGLCTGALQAFAASNKPLVPITCFSSNGLMLSLAKNPAAKAFVITNPAYLSVLAMQAAVKVLSGKHVPQTQELVPPCFYKGGVLPAGAHCQKIQIGVNALPTLSPALTLPSSPSFMTIPVKRVVP